MADWFDFAIRKADLPRLNALRLDMGSDFWPEAAFAVFRSAMAHEDAVADLIPESILDRARRAAKARGYFRAYSTAVRVRQYDPAPEVVEYLDRFASRCGLPSPRIAAIALVAFWAACPEARPAWPGAPLTSAGMADFGGAVQ